MHLLCGEERLRDCTIFRLAPSRPRPHGGVSRTASIHTRIHTPTPEAHTACMRTCVHVVPMHGCASFLLHWCMDMAISMDARRLTKRCIYARTHACHRHGRAWISPCKPCHAYIEHVLPPIADDTKILRCAYGKAALQEWAPPYRARIKRRLAPHC